MHHEMFSVTGYYSMLGVVFPQSKRIIALLCFTLYRVLVHVVEETKVVVVVVVVGKITSDVFKSVASQ